MVVKTMPDLRQILCEEIDNLREKKTTPGQLNAIVNAIGKHLFSVKLELDYCKMQGKTPHMRLLENGTSDLKTVKAA